jgi:glutaredoxin
MSSVRLAALAALVGCASLVGAAANAQVFRIVGPDGRVTFSDRPPPDGKATAAPTVAISGGGSPMASLPAELRTAANRFPVTLYTGPDCQPCLLARSFLATRGVPYTEKTVSTAEDGQALQRLSGDSRLPFLTIGGQHVRGFSDVEWAQYIEAAGYPRTSQLPPSFRNPAATPLVAVQAAPQPTAQQQPTQAPSASSAPRPSDPSPTNPLGIRF